MKPNGLKNKTRENHKIDGLSPDANKLRGHSEIINVEALTKNIDLAWETTRTPAEFRSKLLIYSERPSQKAQISFKTDFFQIMMEPRPFLLKHI